MESMEIGIVLVKEAEDAGLNVYLREEREKFYVCGWSALSEEKQALFREKLKENRESIIKYLKNRLYPASQKEIYSLQYRYTNIDDLGKALKIHNIELEIHGDDFRLAKKYPLAKLCEYSAFLNNNEELINILLRKEDNGRRESS